MSEAKYRIPRMAMAVMVLGANGCGDDDGGGSSKDPDERLQDLGKKTCKLVFSCEDGPWTFDPDDPDQDFTNEKECIASFVRFQKELLDVVSTKCRDAYLSYYECLVSAGCDGDTKGKCKASYQAYQDACADEM